MRDAFRNRGELVLFALCLVPVGLWVAAAPLGIRFDDAPLALNSVGVVVGLFAMTLFALNFVLGVRLKFVDRLYGGLDKMFALHRFNGKLVVWLLVVHVAFVMGGRVLGSTQNDTPVVFSSEVPTIVLGALGLAISVAVLYFTVYRRLNHELFVYVHRVFGLAFVLGALHAFRTPGTKALSPSLTYYMLAVATVGLVAYIYRTFGGGDLVPRYDYRVGSVRRLDQSVTEIAMTPEDQHMRYIPGQFLFVTFYSDAMHQEFHPVSVTPEGASAVVSIQTGALGKQAHPFSIASAPQDPELKIAVKALGDFTQAVRVLETGALARVEGPFGRFSHLNVPNKKQVWIAGGIGITPFLSMARSLDSDEYEIDFFYAMERGDQGYFLDELHGIADRHPRLRVIPISKDKLGFLTADDVSAVTVDLSNVDILICGPPPMMDSLVSQFTAKGVPTDRIHFERFAFGSS